VYASKGGSNVAAPLVSNRRPKRGICLKVIGTSVAKTTVHARLRQTEQGARFMHYPHGNGFDGEYFEQLGAEAPKQVKRRGYVFTEWHKIRSRNEALDLEVLALAAIEILNPDWQALAAKARDKEPAALDERKPETGDARPAGKSSPKRAFRLTKPQFRGKWRR
jgi:phage terminase large subunit GpA-like protein